MELSKEQELCLAILDILRNEVPPPVFVPRLSMVLPSWIKDKLPDIDWYEEVPKPNILGQPILNYYFLHQEQVLVYALIDLHTYYLLSCTPAHARPNQWDPLPTNMEELDRYLQTIYLSFLDHVPEPSRPTKYNLDV